jgi:hypothetical protein
MSELERENAALRDRPTDEDHPVVHVDDRQPVQSQR